MPRLVEAATSACASGAVISGGDSVDWRDELGEGEALAAMTTAATLSSESFYPQKQVSTPTLALTLTLTLTLTLAMILTLTLALTAYHSLFTLYPPPLPRATWRWATPSP